MAAGGVGEETPIRQRQRPHERTARAQAWRQVCRLQPSDLHGLERLARHAALPLLQAGRGPWHARAAGQPAILLDLDLF